MKKHGGRTVKQYLLYLARWQMSTPLLALCVWYLATLNGWNELAATIISNLIGGLLFFWIDRLIFKGDK